MCPPSLAKGEKTFTIAAADNIDHDTSSVTAKSSFHGTAISLIQFDKDRQSGIYFLKFSFTIVLQAYFKPFHFLQDRFKVR